MIPPHPKLIVADGSRSFGHCPNRAPLRYQAHGSGDLLTARPMQSDRRTDGKPRRHGLPRRRPAAGLPLAPRDHRQTHPVIGRRDHPSEESCPAREQLTGQMFGAQHRAVRAVRLSCRLGAHNLSIGERRTASILASRMRLQRADGRATGPVLFGTGRRAPCPRPPVRGDRRDQSAASDDAGYRIRIRVGGVSWCGPE